MRQWPYTIDSFGNLLTGKLEFTSFKIKKQHVKTVHLPFIYLKNYFSKCSKWKPIRSHYHYNLFFSFFSVVLENFWKLCLGHSLFMYALVSITAFVFLLAFLQRVLLSLIHGKYRQKLEQTYIEDTRANKHW